jgi:formylglycine-generating enzyme
MNKKITWYYRNPTDGYEMVLVPGGWFQMGSVDDPNASTDEKPAHLHYLPPFYIGIACVNVAQVSRFVKDTGYIITEPWEKDLENHPVRFVSWHDATAYCKWAGLRLPTEAEKELSARGYESFMYPWGSDWHDGQNVCWGEKKGPREDTSPVYDHPKGVSPFGLFQQSGNLWEWCEDWYNETVYQKYAEGDFCPPQTGNYRVLRGGSWRSILSERFRGADRSYNLPDYRYSLIGFRAALNAII